MTADVLVRRAQADGASLRWEVATLAGGLPGQWAAEDGLAREGLDKATLGREAFAERLGSMADEARQQLAVLAADVRLGFDVDAAAAAGQAAAGAARTAFVRLFEAGLVVEADRVVGACPRCATTVGTGDAVAVEVEGETLTLRLALVDSPDGATHLNVECAAPELLPGVVAVAVPDGWPDAGASALVPVAASTVPVVADDSVSAPVLLVPAHDPCALDVTRRLGLVAVPVIDGSGAVCAPGPLAGLARYAARAAARQLLDAEQAVVASVAGAERAERCAACSTVLVPLLGRHWFLSLADLRTAAADAVRDGRLAVWPSAARDDLLTGAGAPGEWCLSQQVWGGVALPVGRCLDCGQVDVSVHPATSCRRCMGDLVAVDDVLDARFVRCVWPLAAVGWPEGGRGQLEGDGGTVLLVVPAGAAGDVLPMVALGLRLAGAVPFDEVAVLAPTGPPGAPTAPQEGDLAAVVAEDGHRVVRVALAWGGLDVDAARDFVARVDEPVPGHVNVERLAEAMAAAFAAASPASALAMVAAAAAEGVRPGDADRLRALAAPFLGS